MKLIITGASGLLGGKLVKLAIDVGHEVYSVYKTHPPIDGRAERIDLTDGAAVDKFVVKRSPEVVIHAASVTDVDLCEVEPELAARVNTEATRFVAEACRRVGAFLVYLSTDYVFDGLRGNYKEQDEPHPINAYGYSKLFGEQQVRRCGNDFCIARTSVVYGWGRDYRPNFAAWIFHRLEQNRKVEVVTDQYASPTLNSNLAKMLLEVVERRLQGVWHLAGSTRTNRYEFAILLAQRCGFNEKLLVPVESHSVAWKAKRPFDSSLDVTKALETLNNKPAPLEEGLKEFVSEAPRP